MRFLGPKFGWSHSPQFVLDVARCTAFSRPTICGDLRSARASTSALSSFSRKPANSPSFAIQTVTKMEAVTYSAK
jgi:hypothetical protein